VGGLVARAASGDYGYVGGAAVGGEEEGWGIVFVGGLR